MQKIKGYSHDEKAQVMVKLKTFSPLRENTLTRNYMLPFWKGGFSLKNKSASPQLQNFSFKRSPSQEKIHRPGKQIPCWCSSLPLKREVKTLSLGCSLFEVNQVTLKKKEKMMHHVGKRPLCHMGIMKAQVSVCLCAVWSGHSHIPQYPLII